MALAVSALELSGSRFALGLAVVVTLAVLVRRPRRMAPAAAAMAVGVLLGVGLGAVGGTTTGTGRVDAGAGGGGLTARVRTWASAGTAIAAHPLVGVGPGQFRSATSPHRDLALVHSEGADRLFLDAHNIVVEYATTTGVTGLVALTVFVALAARRARGPLLGFAAMALAVHLVEPQFVGTTPLAFLALGAAGKRTRPAPTHRTRAAVALLVLGALVAGGFLVAGDLKLNQAALDFHAVPARAAVRLLPPWPEPARLVARIALFRAVTTHGRTGRAETLRWRRRAVAEDQTDPRSWTELGEAQLYFGEPHAAERSFERALYWDPWSVRALNGLGQAAMADHDARRARRAFERSLLVSPSQVKVRRLLTSLTGP
jgi:hypothetical protein